MQAHSLNVGAITHRDGRSEQRRRRNDELARVFGGAIGDALADSSVTEVMVNPDGRLYIDRLHVGMAWSGLHIDARDTENAIVTAASELGAVADADHPSLAGALPLDGSRIQALMPPIVSAPALSIRKHRKQGENGVPALTIDDFASTNAERGSFVSPTVSLAGLAVPEIISIAVEQRWNVIINGSTSSGKTAFGGAYLDEISRFAPLDRLIIIEDTIELRCKSENHVSLLAGRARSQAQLLKDSMRLRPDRIIFGEVRDASAHDLIKAWNTGHNGGFCTIHANSAESALRRLEQLVQEANVPVIPSAIADAVDLIVTMRKGRDGRGRVVELVRVTKNLDGARYVLEHLELTW